MTSDETILDLNQEPQWCGKCNYAKRDNCCEEARELERREVEKALAIEAASLGGARAAREYVLEDFDYKLQPTRLHAKYKEAINAVKQFDSKKDNLFLFGGPGSGKSHLGTCALRLSLPQRRIVVQGSAFTGELMARKMDNAPLPYFDGRTVMLDDVEKCSIKEFGVAEVQRFFNKWYADDKGGLIITSNKDLGQLAEAWQDDSIPSRIAGMSKVFGFVGATDIRIKRRNK